jgi:DNA-binding NtrC family response regulator
MIILILEDDISLQYVMKKTFEKNGFDCLVCDDGISAIRKAFDADVAIVDIHTPLPVTGRDFITAFAKLNNGRKIIVYTGDTKITLDDVPEADFLFHKNENSLPKIVDILSELKMNFHNTVNF